MKYFDSTEAEKLKRLITEKKNYLQQTTSKYAFQKIQSEIILLEKDILPIIMSNTMIIHSEVSKYCVRALEAALNFNPTGLLIYIPINENYVDNPLVCVANSRANLNHGTPGAMEFYIESINMDGQEAKPSIHHLNINNFI